MKHIISTVIGFSILLFGQLAFAQEADILQVATIERQPFVIQNETGLSGFSIELWEEIAKFNNWDYNFIVKDRFVDLLAAPRIGEADAAIANISITADREEIMDFSTPIYNGGMLIMVSNTSVSSNLDKLIFDEDFWWIMFYVLLTFFVTGGLWYGIIHKTDISIEKAEKIYWRLATFGSYGEDLPKLRSTRIIFMIWMASLFFGTIAATAELTSSLVILKERAAISEISDLKDKKVGVIGGSTSEAFLRKQQLSTITYSNIDDLFESVARGRIDAVVHDAPVILYYATHKGAGDVIVAGEIFNPENYGVALPSDSELLEPINQTLLRLRENGTYTELHNKWFK